MKIHRLIQEDFTNYRLPSMFIATNTCTWKCCKDCGQNICQNMPLANSPTIELAPSKIYSYFSNNPITHAVVFGGLEPFDQFDEILEVIAYFRNNNDNSPFVIYTGYNKEEIVDKVTKLSEFPNIIIKFGRFMPNCDYHYDNILGVNLASPNQYAEKIS